jgi:hypothetical protein
VRVKLVIYKNYTEMQVNKTLNKYHNVLEVVNYLQTYNNDIIINNNIINNNL